MSVFDEFIERFGASRIDEKVISRLEEIASEKKMTLHPFLKRGFVYAHRDLNKLLDMYEKGKKFYIYTGRGPSSLSMHIGHLVPFYLTAYLQKLFDAHVVVQITDDEKYGSREQTLEETEEFTRENIKDIMAVGFDMKKTFIFRNTEYIGNLYLNLIRIKRVLRVKDMMSCYGSGEEDNLLKFSFPPLQMAPCFSSSFKHLFGEEKIPCLIPCAIDQDPYFRQVRDISEKLGELKPFLIYTKYIPSLKGVNLKMSSSVPDSAIYLSDGNKKIKKKIGRAFSGGGDTKEAQEKFGAKLEVDVAYQYLRYFMEDDKELEMLGEEYRAGKRLTGEVKGRLIEILKEMIDEHKRRRV